MATRLYSVNYGQTKQDVVHTTGSATTGSVDITIDLAAVPNKKAALDAIEYIKQVIIEGKYPPA